MEQNSNNKNVITAVIIIMALVIIGLVFVVISLLTAGKDDVANSMALSIFKNSEESLEKELEKVNGVNEVVEEEEDVIVEKTKEPETVTNNNNNSQVSSSITSNDWKSGEFMLDGVAYKLNTDYTNLKNNGWYVDLEKLGYADGYILNKNDKTYSTIDLQNDKYSDADVAMGFINLNETAKDVSKCQFWAISVNNKYSDTPVNFELPGGIKNGSTLQEIEAAYGKPEEDDIYRSEDLKYTSYSYSNDYTEDLRLTIYDDEGLVEFDYKIY